MQVNLIKLNHLLVLVIKIEKIFLVKPSIKYFSAKNKDVYTKTLRTKTSAVFFKKKSIYHPDWQNLANWNENKKDPNTYLNKHPIYLKIKFTGYTSSWFNLARRWSLFSEKQFSNFSKTKKVYKKKNNQNTIAKNAINCAVTTKNV